MKSFPSLFLHYVRNRATRRSLRVLMQFLATLFAMVAVYSVLFHYLMAWEGRQYSWITGVYWTLTVMSTLGFGDITFATDLGKTFSIIVLMSGIVFLLTMLPFTFIQYFYLPWLDAQARAGAPRELPGGTKDHVILTSHDPVDFNLAEKFAQYHHDYVIVVEDVQKALELQDLNLRVAVGDLGDPADLPAAESQ